MVSATEARDAFAREQVDVMPPVRLRVRPSATEMIVRPKAATYLYVKFIVEWVAALVLLIAVLPLLAMLAVVVKVTSRGPAFYSQDRLGLNGRRYKILKLRSMVQDAEVGTGAVWAAKGDSRITKVGRFLRNTHLDELPQLWNVLRGEMGLIGPRPERPEIAARIGRSLPEFRLRLAVRPGVTGLAQMLLPADDPNDTELDCVRKKLAHDIYYIRKLGLSLDIRVALSTPCYFLSAAVDALRHSLVSNHAMAVEQCEQLESIIRGSRKDSI